jgi:hypothetical protein
MFVLENGQVVAYTSKQLDLFEIEGESWGFSKSMIFCKEYYENSDPIVPKRYMDFNSRSIPFEGESEYW